MIPKLYFYSDGIEKHGPFTIEELKEKHITKQTLIWLEGEIEWHPLTSFLSLYEELKPHLKQDVKQEPITVPPPLPKINHPRSKINPVIPISIWTIVHLFALLMSYTGVMFFNVETPPDKDKFWPFVDFKETYYSRPADASSAPGASYRAEKNTEFNGVFYQYDLTEFALYVGSVWVIYLIVRLSARNNSNHIT